MLIKQCVQAVFLSVTILTLLFLAPLPLHADDLPKKILILVSQDPYLPFSSIVIDGIRSTVKDGSPGPARYYFEYLDGARIADNKFESKYVTFLHDKYAEEHFDLAYAIAPDAINFLIKYKESLVPNTPIVFVGSDKNGMPQLDPESNATGVLGLWQVRRTADLALALQPGTKKIVLVAGNTPIDQARIARAREEFADDKSNIEFVYLTNRTMEEVSNELAKLSPGTVVIYLSFLLDSDGNSFSAPDAVDIMSRSSSVPLYGTTQTEFGAGIVGGYVTDYEAIGLLAGKTGLRILNGERAGSIPVATLDDVPMIDWRQLRRWNIADDNVPAGSLVRFKEPTAWERYRLPIAGAILFSVGETLLIGWLLFIRARRKKAEEESLAFASLARAEHQRLDEVVANVPGIVWESRIGLDFDDRRIEFVSDYAEKMLGYTREEIGTEPNFWRKVVLAEDQPRLDEALKEIYAGHGQGEQQFRCRTKDGAVIWVDAFLVATYDDAGSVAGLCGVAIDITGRKIAEEELRDRELDLAEAQRLSQTGSWEWDPKTDTVKWSEELYNISGYNPLLRAPTFEEHQKHYTHESFERLAAAVTAALEHGESYELELEMVRYDDERHIWTHARGEVLRDCQSNIIKLRGTCQDISEAKKAEQALKKALEEVNQLKAQLQEENIYLREMIKLEHKFDEIIGSSDSLKYVLYKIEQVAPTDATVLITGETGTGKELVARAIHSTSHRKHRPLITVNCAALSANLIESELFGHERGAFTGASTLKIGRFELADGATIFLDEISELPFELQAKLLRVIQEEEFERLGSSKTIKVDVRIIAATNRNLEAEVKKGTFREDLLFRLNVFPLTIPPLRERKSDIPALVEHFTTRFSKKLGKDIRSVSPATIRKLSEYWWPGNIRELANVIERSVINAQGDNLQILEVFGQRGTGDSTPAQAGTLEEMERKYITAILNDVGWKIEGSTGAARTLGINPSTLRTKMAKLGITKQEHQTRDAAIDL